ncbi:MAG: hypothetical protein IPO35_18325 [Uliginosibacterium sp.]|nr:hypothetical protein [Uliginosibacterium sp.]
MTRQKILMALCLAWGGLAQAQMAGSSVSVGQVHLSDARLDSGSAVSVSTTQFSLGHSMQIAPTTSVGIQLRADQESWTFDGPVPALWQDVRRLSLGVPLTHRFSESWAAMITPRVEWAGEEGSKGSDAIAWGLIAGASKQLAPGRRIGLGLSLSRTLDNSTELFPFFLVDWRFDDHWRLFNPLGLGLSGPAGLELAYRVTPELELGLGGAWRNTRFRLAEDNRRAAGGVGQFSYVPVFLHAAWKPVPALSLDAFAGVLLNGRLKIEDRNAQRVESRDMKSTPAFGLTAAYRF